MKVFWSWQGDRSQAVCKRFVRDALDQAVRRLREAPETDESSRPREDEDAEDVVVDQDTQGEAGMVDISATILRKIEQAAVFVADLTTIGNSDTGRQMANPNVLIELGYAMKCLPSTRLLLVANTAWGFSVERLPFDIRHRRGPITYRLARDAGHEDRARVFEQLVQELEVSLRQMIVEARGQKAAELALGRTPSTTDPARWWEPGDVLYTRSGDPRWNSGPGINVPAPTGPVVYFRVLPREADRRVREPDLKGLAQRIPLLMSFGTNGRAGAHNEWGGISYADEPDGANGWRVQGATQVFRNREIWAVDAISADTSPIDLEASGGHPLLSDTLLEQWTLKGMTEIAAAAAEHAGLRFPLDVEFGVGAARGLKITIGRRRLSGPCQLPFIRCAAELRSPRFDDVQNIAVQLFKKLWEGFGQDRPKNNNNIPPREKR